MTSDQINNLKKVYWQQKTVPSYYFPNKKNIFKKIQQTFDTKNDIETQDYLVAFLIILVEEIKRLKKIF